MASPTCPHSRSSMLRGCDGWRGIGPWWEHCIQTMSDLGWPIINHSFPLSSTVRSSTSSTARTINTGQEPLYTTEDWQMESQIKISKRIERVWNSDVHYLHHLSIWRRTTTPTLPRSKAIRRPSIAHVPTLRWCSDSHSARTWARFWRRPMRRR